MKVGRLPRLSALLRISTKYKIKRSTVQVLKVIQATWPQDLASHDSLADARVQRAAAANPNAHHQGSNPVYANGPYSVNPAAVIALLRKCGHTSPSTLAPLFYALARISDMFGRGLNLAPLTHSDTAPLVTGVHRLHVETWKVVSAVGTGAIPLHDATCGTANTGSVHTVRVPFLTRAGQCPIEALRISAQEFQRRSKDRVVCAQCSQLLLSRIAALRAREQVWARMEESFELRQG